VTPSLRESHPEIEALNRLTARINEGLLLDDILERVYVEFREFIPYDRIGLALIEDEGDLVRARWARSEAAAVRLVRGYAAPLEGSSLQAIRETLQPRILNDLEKYLAQKPWSDSTALVVAEGMRSSLTCPLSVGGNARGFLFFSSMEVGTYADAHVELFQEVAGQLSVIIEKGRLTSDLAAKQREIAQQNVALRLLSEHKSAILGVVAHDLRNPLHVIQMDSELMLDPAVEFSEPEKRESIESIRRQARYLLELLDGLLDLTQIDAGKLVLHVADVDMGELLAQAVERFRKLAGSKRIRLALTPVPPAMVRADRLRVSQVLDNILSNAVKFSPPESTVRVSAQRRDGSWRVEIEDQGPGITAEDRGRLFQEFERLSARPTGGEKSVGLGLAIARRVLEAHGGRIGVDSAPERGSTFWFTLPAAGGA
jgi:hypothetical protein